MALSDRTAGLRFAKLDPSGNITVIVLDPVQQQLYTKVAVEIMGRQGLAADQVGFVAGAKDPKALARLNMMGGEFCGNAARAFAAYLAFTRHPGVVWHNSEAEVPIEVSGYNGLLTPRVLTSPDVIGRSYVTSPMPTPNEVDFVDFGQSSLALVKFDGISHAVTWGLKPTVETFNEISSIYGSPGDSAFGVMFFSEDTSRVVPLVAVRNTGSLVWEGSCASGAVAVASALAFRNQNGVELKLSQPGGVLDVSVTWDKGILDATVGGQVNMIACGLVFAGLPAVHQKPRE